MGNKKGNIGIFDYLIGLGIVVCLGLALYPVFLMMDVAYVWYFFVASVCLLIASIIMLKIRITYRVSEATFILGICWFIETTIIICPWVSTPLL